VHGAVFDDAAVYGVNVWDMQGVPASSDGLVITLDQPQITVDDMRLAQFIYLLINNDTVRDVIDTITSKVVLILGNFSRTRKPTLDRIRGELRHRDLTPVVFDFAVPMSGRIIDTVALLARMSRYVIVDLTDPRMTPMELGEISDYGIPIQTVILAGQTPIAGLVDLQRKFHWVLPTFTFNNDEHLAASLDEYVLAPAAEKRDEMMLAT
jgi:hypothetical protein